LFVYVKNELLSHTCASIFLFQSPIALANTFASARPNS
jgi:hypothetical protein